MVKMLSAKRYKMILMIFLILIMTILSNAQDSPDTISTPEPLTLQIWLPDVLFATDENIAYQILQTQTEDFISTESNLDVELDVQFRIRTVDDLGGILSSLRSASMVAPGALPHLTLVPRQDFITAVNSGLIQSVEGLITSSIVSNLDNRLALGQVSNELFGVPYLIDLTHSVYSLADVDNIQSSWLFDDILTREQSIILPLSRLTGISDILYVQYLNAGGRANADGLIYNAEAIATILNFYEQASVLELITDISITRTLSDIMIDDLTDEMAVITTTSNLLQWNSEENPLQFASLPTSSDESLAILDGWIWVLVTTTPEKQDIAMRYVAWLMEHNRQSEIALNTYTLPSQLQSLQQALPTTLDVDMMSNLITNASLNPPLSGSNAFASSLQDAVLAVIRQEMSADDALMMLEVEHDN